MVVDYRYARIANAIAANATGLCRHLFSVEFGLDLVAFLALARALNRRSSPCVNEPPGCAVTTLT
jgi:hypothetical protein